MFMAFTIVFVGSPARSTDSGEILQRARTGAEREKLQPSLPAEVSSHKKQTIFYSRSVSVMEEKVVLVCAAPTHSLFYINYHIVLGLYGMSAGICASIYEA